MRGANAGCGVIAEQFVWKWRYFDGMQRLCLPGKSTADLAGAEVSGAAYAAGGEAGKDMDA